MKTVIVRNFAVGILLSTLCLIPALLMAGRSDEKQYAVNKMAPLISAELLISSGAIVDRVPDIGKISASPFGKTLVGQGDFVYILPHVPVEKGAMFYVYGGPERIIHPVTGRFIGDLIRIKGIVEIVGEEGGNMKALVLKSFEDVAIDDLLGEYYPVAPIELSGRKPVGINGFIVKLKGQKLIASGGNIVYLDKGKGDGVAVGDLFDVTSGEKPYIPVGVIQVISVRHSTSTALIKTARGVIQLADAFGN